MRSKDEDIKELKHSLSIEKEDAVKVMLRLPHRNDATIAKFCSLWTFWLVIQLINSLFRIQKKASLPDAP